MAIPVTLGLLVRYLKESNESEDNATDGPFDWTSARAKVYYCAAAICLIQCINIYVAHPYFFENYRMGMEVRVANSNLIYNKALRLSNGALRHTTVGTIVNLLSNDVNRFDISLVYAHYLITGPILMVVCVGLLWYYIGASCLAGIALLIIYIPFQGLMGKWFSKLRSKSSILTDERLRLMNEIIPAMRVIKMYVWEKPFGQLVQAARVSEINKIHIAMVLRSINLSIFYISAKLITFISLIVFIVNGNELSAENVFVSIALINQLREVMTLLFPYAISLSAESSISLNRIQKFLLSEEFDGKQQQLKDRTITNTTITTTTTPPTNQQSADNEINDKYVAISKTIDDEDDDDNDSEEDEDPYKITVDNISAEFETREGVVQQILSDISFTVRPRKLTVIIGAVGSGKTAVLMAILNELKLQQGSVSVSGRLGYASQESWIFGGTVRDNILFGKSYDERKFKQVVHVAALEEDMKQLPFGDQTIVGDRGVTLSGGQRARVSLARTLYSNPDCYLLDDPLSAVDSAVAKHIFEKCIKGYLKRNCVILVTHQLQFIKAADQIVVLSQGKLRAIGSYTDLLKEGIDLIKYAGDTELLRPEDDQNKQSQHFSDVRRRTSSVSDIFGSRLPTISSMHSFGDDGDVDLGVGGGRGSAGDDIIGQQILANKDNEEYSADPSRAGQTSPKIYWTFLRAGAGWVLLPTLLLSNILTQVTFTGGEYWLSQWTKYHEDKQIAKDTGADLQVDTSWMISYDETINIAIYTALVVVCFVFTITRTVCFFTTCMRASVRLHNKLLESVIRAPIAFFDRYPIGMILNRVSRDLGIIDDLLPPTAFDAIELLAECLAILVLCVIVDYWLVIPSVALIICLMLVRQFALGTIRRLKKVEGTARTPIFSHLASTLSGLATVRSFGMEREFSRKYDILQDRHTNTYFMFMTCNRWFGIVLDELCLVYIIATTILLVANVENGSAIGLTLSQAIQLTGGFQWAIRQSAEVETQMTSVERVAELRKIDREFESDVKPPEDWPKTGQIVMQDVCLKYGESADPVLKNLNLVINGGETVGIVGRTGAGKSSIIATLFRMTPPSGLIEIDGIDTASISLASLRRNISIIPQEPILFTETVRKNLDPFGECDDSFIWEVLEKVQLKDTINRFPQKLDQRISESGGSFSVGQKQLICLARAILRNNKILVLDEATANVDPQTDALIQDTIRNEFSNCTILTIAHRLHTIMDYDKVLVLDAGRLAQFDAPHNLVQDRDGIFAQMIETTGHQMEHHLKQIALKAYIRKIQ
ncbi:ATP-binding cassette sub-family C member 4-like [Oppia nitens]|uniref:ATP-binding cassette sub-family C member 4-like n=1 Tax=Oppia nitens TaxID=1686743 RepID=UPI0023DC83A5|nr:ATP-binding cassette sub-family C member 4-like [Oppia nitens]